MTTITIELTEERAEALAQFCKRVGYGTFRSHTTTDEKAYAMQAAVNEIAKSLIAAGYNPR
jgi:hypothetical protein